MKRYPGIRPFRSDEQHLFFGRDTDTERLLRLIDLQQVVILYGKSGYGKSSLLSAGVFPRLQDDGQLQSWEIRLGPYKPGESLPPAASLRLAVGRRVSESPILPSSLAEPSLWQALKNLHTPTNRRFLLVFDQFEELFTYPTEQVLEFKNQLSEALFSIVPKRYEKAFASAQLPPETEDAIYTPFELKVLFSIRADRMSLLNGLKDYLPNLLQHGYELDALDEASAKVAILLPAKLPNIEFETPPFSFTPDALSAIFTALRDEQGRIETSTLQIVCKHIEDNIVYGWMTSGRRADGTSASATGQRVVSADDLGDISVIFSDFYENTIAGLAEEERNPARHLIEDVLIKDGIRLPFAEQALMAQPGVTTDLLQRLSTASLLRVERDDQGRMLYEVGHDTLVRPIEEAAKARRESEKQAAVAAEAQREKEAERERLHQEAERQRHERKKIESGRRRNLVFGLSALALLAFAFYQTWVANKAKHDAEEAGIQAVSFILENAKQQIKALDYNAAVATLRSSIKLVGTRPLSSPLGSMRPLVARALMEPAFFANETGRAKQADNLAADINQLLGVADLTTFEKLSNLPTLRPTFDTLHAQYYGKFAHIPGGADTIGNKDNSLIIAVSPFRFAITETTWWQYNLFCTATGYPQPKRPGWGSEGDNPIGNVSWYDAVVYCNWRSQHENLQPVYFIDSVGRTQSDGWEVSFDRNANGYRLPTEAEWEYAARASTDFEFAGDSLLKNVGWFHRNSSSRTHPVGDLKPNGFGLYDMCGNVWEWCHNWYETYPKVPVKDYFGPIEGNTRVLRGGAWLNFVELCSVSRRIGYEPISRGNDCGFRLAQNK
ncbi:MAG: SUMF1/EgtB/PvdO family nonheme iron enzyme [Phycisphaerae bacterium]|nr:SUMF1/EgtB/PvdO family nonheme iron enzyme [Saprospiraceae bacterium]